MYVGALDVIVPLVAAGLGSGGLFAFSVESHDGPQDVLLRPSRRYAHSEAYVRRVLSASGFTPLSMETEIIRQDRGEGVEGLIVVAQSVVLPLRERLAAA